MLGPGARRRSCTRWPGAWPMPDGVWSAPPRPRFSRRKMAFPWFSWKARPIPLPPFMMRCSPRPCVVAAGRPLPDVRKLDGVSPRMLAVLSAALPAALFLVEADGAARKPLKAPAAHEPVLPEPLDCCVAVVGLDSVGQPLGRRARAPFRTGLRGGGQEPGSPVRPRRWPVWWSTPKGCSATVRRGAAVLCSPIRGTGRGHLMPLPKPPPCPVPWRGLREARLRAGASR